MLGTVLNRQAEEERRQREEAEAFPITDAQSSVQTDPSSVQAQNTRASYEEASYSSSDEEEGSDDEEESLSPHTRCAKFQRTIRGIAERIRSAAVTLADVDNVWDSPDANDFRHGGVINYGSIDYDDNSRSTNPTRASVIYNAVTGTTAPTRNRTAVLFWFLLLSLSYASERSTFKLIVDRVGPFRLFSAELIVGCHAALLGLIVLVGEEWRRRDKNDEGLYFGSRGLPIPLADIGCEYC